MFRRRAASTPSDGCGATSATTTAAVELNERCLSFLREVDIPDEEVESNARLNLADTYLDVGRLDVPPSTSSGSRTSSEDKALRDTWLLWRYRQHLLLTASTYSWPGPSRRRSGQGSTTARRSPTRATARSTSARRHGCGPRWRCPRRARRGRAEAARALAIATEIGHPPERWRVAALLGDIAAAIGDLDAAVEHRRTADRLLADVEASLTDPAARSGHPAAPPRTYADAVLVRADLRSFLGLKNLALAVALRIVAAVTPRRRVERRPREERCRKLFVGGCPRSGTTWVVSLLQNHPMVVSGRESHAYSELHRHVVRHGRRNVRMWAKVLLTDDRTRRTDPSEPRLLTGWVGRRTMRELAVTAMAARGWNDQDAADHLVEEILERYFAEHGGTAHHLLVEKTPSNLLFAEDILRFFPEARVVEVLRDGRDVCVSIGELDLPWASDFADRGTQVALWRSYAEAGTELRGQPAHADRVLLVRFEDLLLDPPAQLRRLWSFAGLDEAPGLAEEALQRADTDLRDPTSHGFFRKGETGDWVNHFTPEDVELFRAQAGEVFEAAGYRW